MPETVTNDALSSVTQDGFTVTSNTESADDITQNFESTQKPKDGPEPDPEKEEAERVKKAASELGKKGAEAAAAKRAEAKAEAKKDEKVKGEEDDAVADEDDPAKEKLGKPRHDAKARMFEATRKEAAAKRELAASQERERQLTERLERLEKLASRVEGGEQKADPNKRPEADEFDDYAEYVRASARWEARQELLEHSKREAVERHTHAITASITKDVESFNEKWRKAIEADPTFSERVDHIVALKPSFLLGEGESSTVENAIADAILQSEQSIELLEHLADNPDDLTRLMRSPSRIALVREFGRIEARLGNGNGKAATTPAPASQAKAPIKPLVGSSQPAGDDLTDDTPFDEWVHKMNAKDRASRRA